MIEMKLTSVAVIALLFALLQPQNSFGYNEKQYARFFVTNTCLECDLYRANFSGADLTNADFSGSNLIRANFQNATLLGVNFNNATLTGANFNGAMWVDGSMCKQGSYGRCIKQDDRD